MNVFLIIEDEEIEQDFIKSIIEEKNNGQDKILIANNGVKALELAAEYKPDFIFVDLMIPEKDGMSTIKELREFLPDSIITIITAYSEFEYAQRAIKYNVFEYLLKPIRPLTLINTLEKMVSSKINSAIQVKKEPSDNKKQSFLEASIKIINESFKERLTLDMIASKLYVNPKYFSHVFKKEIGISFTTYVTKLKINHACLLLETTDYPAYRISIECGFSDPSYFNRVFRSMMNMTPKAYRQQSRVKKYT